MAGESGWTPCRNAEVQLHAFFTFAPNGGNFEHRPAASRLWKGSTVLCELTFRRLMSTTADEPHR